MNITKLTLIAAFALSATSAFSHAVLEKKQSSSKATYKAVIGITHGCEGEATLKVRVQIPEGLVAVKPTPKAGWALTTVNGPYERVYNFHGPRTEGVKEITWSGKLADAHYDEFQFRGYITDRFKAGETIYLPTVQECANGKLEWTQIPSEGQNPHDLELPAPAVRVTGEAHAHH